MGVKRIVVFVLFCAVLVFLWVQLYSMMRETARLRAETEELSRQQEALVRENTEIERQEGYYTHSENVEKFLRSRFNYKKPGEQMIIVVPGE